MQQFNCSRSTAVNALKAIEASKHIVGRQGSGMFVSLPSPREAPREILFCGNNLVPSSLYPFSEMIYSLDLGAFPVRYVDIRTVQQRLESLCHPGVAIIWVLPLESSLSQMSYVQSRGIPQLLINRSFGEYDCICTDAAESIRQGLSWLLNEAGHDIAFITSPPSFGQPYVQERSLAFYESCFALGARLLPELIFKTRYRDFMTDMPLIVEKLFERPNPPKGIFIPCCDFVVPFVLCATKYRKELGKDYFLLSFDMIPEFLGKQGMTFLRQPFHLFQLEIKAWLKHCANVHAPSFRKWLKCDMIVGKESN